MFGITCQVENGRREAGVGHVKKTRGDRFLVAPCRLSYIFTPQVYLYVGVSGIRAETKFYVKEKQKRFCRGFILF